MAILSPSLKHTTVSSIMKNIKIAILVPAYKEELVIDKTITSLLAAGF